MPSSVPEYGRHGVGVKLRQHREVLKRGKHARSSGRLGFQGVLLGIGSEYGEVTWTGFGLYSYPRF